VANVSITARLNELKPLVRFQEGELTVGLRRPALSPLVTDIVASRKDLAAISQRTK